MGYSLYGSGFLLLPLFFPCSALTRQLEDIQHAAVAATRDMNLRGDTVAERLRDIPACAWELATVGVREGAARALTLAHMQSRHGDNFVGIAPSPDADDEDDFCN